ncbi:Metal-dependent hydrolase, endonuclease/exonuclease/phosphatase family [Daejeonella rubra]|uniref:Metal-dependent hydrolase, endonuclease/exonuclease/phosphatase family n=1 Tax=Daejeonella rubra TaxID=990371 RepID=A0A1G9PYM1_9SPHI|nr:endonuclease/exonuclease/phosphatase family protein [Daejeonella rubra]SDM03876.1 Metal-dependent hydrolase, endonuclease/exonuclease/phosphatase family [Daejeonella rubra]
MKRIIAVFLIFSAGISQLNSQTLKVMSYNIHVGQNSKNEDKLREIAEFIKASKADIIGLQEVDSVCNRSGKIDQMKFLAEQTGMHYAYARHFAFDGGSYGLGVLSRYPLHTIKNNRISVTIAGKPETRALLSASIFQRGKEISFATVHMDYRDQRSRLKQSEEIVKMFSGNKNPVILTGDFNARPGTKELLALEGFFADVSYLSGPTYPAVKPLNRIDFIMLSKAHLNKVKKQETLAVEYSDHLPVVSSFKWTW